MKLIKSISLAAAALSLTAPAIALVNPSITTAQAATKKATGTITVGNNNSSVIGVYNAAGKQKNQKIKNGTTFKYYGAPKLINNEYTYKIAKDKYVPTSAISTLNGKSV